MRGIARAGDSLSTKTLARPPIASHLLPSFEAELVILNTNYR